MGTDLQGLADGLVSAIAARDPGDLPLVLLGYVVTGVALWLLGGRRWAFVYVALIPFVNWSFSWAPTVTLPFAPEFGFNPGHHCDGPCTGGARLHPKGDASNGVGRDGAGCWLVILLRHQPISPWRPPRLSRSPS